MNGMGYFTIAIALGLGISGCETKQAEAPKPPPQDPQIALFKSGMKSFIDESKSLCRAMDITTDQGTYKKRIETLQDVYSKIPDPPRGDKIYYACHKAAKRATLEFEFGGVFLSYADKFRALNSNREAENAARSFRNLAKFLRRNLNELEAATSDHRMPEWKEFESPKAKVE